MGKGVLDERERENEIGNKNKKKMGIFDGNGDTSRTSMGRDIRDGRVSDLEDKAEGVHRVVLCCVTAAGSLIDFEFSDPSCNGSVYKCIRCLARAYQPKSMVALI